MTDRSSAHAPTCLHPEAPCDPRNDKATDGWCANCFPVYYSQSRYPSHLKQPVAAPTPSVEELVRKLRALSNQIGIKVQFHDAVLLEAAATALEAAEERSCASAHESHHAALAELGKLDKAAP